MTPPTSYQLLSVKMNAYIWILRVIITFRSSWCVGAVMTAPYSGVLYRRDKPQFEPPLQILTFFRPGVIMYAIK